MPKRSRLLVLHSVFVYLISLCGANDTFCQLFDEDAKSVAIYCENYRGAVPMDCTEDNIDSIESSTQVTDLKAIGCDEEIVLDVMARFRRVRYLDISFAMFLELDMKLDLIVKLNASHNQFHHLNVTHFRGATHLQLIDLSYNYFASIPILPSNDQLKVVHLVENPIATFDCSHFATMPYVSVYITWKYLTSFFGNMDCEGKRLRVIRNGRTEAILPAWSGKYELHCIDNGFSNLRYFMAGTNSFEHIKEILPCLGSQLVYLDLSGNPINALDTDAFERFNDLSRLYLRDTQLMHFDLNGPFEYLIVLDLSDNKIQIIDDIDRLQHIHLDEFRVAGNGLANTPEMVDALQSTIERLVVSGNFMGAVSNSTFQRFIALKALNLSDTALFLANDFNPFRQLVDLIILDISHNTLDTLNFTVIAITLNQLTEFYAADCEITDADVILLHLGSGLEALDLSANPIDHFQLNATHFELLRNLQYVNLSHTNLMAIEYGTFHHQSLLQSLDVSQNRLQQIDVWLISDKLEHLHLDRNELMNIYNFERSRFPRLQWLALSQNWLRLDFLQQLLNQSSDGGIEFIGDPYDQKHHQPVPSTGQAIGDFLYTVYDKIKFW